MSSSDIAKYYVAQRPEFIDFVKADAPFARAIDIGCAGGKLGSELVRQGIVGSCDGIEPFPDAAALASQSLNRVWTGSLEANAANVPWPEYNLLMMADVLEHVVDPWAALRFLHQASAPGCRLVLSVPNIRHYKVLLPLLFKDEFRYRDHGIMDSTHLHFYTGSSIVETLNECGWKVTRRDSHMKRSYRRWYMPTRLLEPFVAVQYLLMAEKQ